MYKNIKTIFFSLNEKVCTKLVVNFLKMDILKMSNFENLKENVCKKFTSLGNRLKPKKIIQKLLA